MSEADNESDISFRSVDHSSQHDSGDADQVDTDTASLDWDRNHGELSFVDGDPTATSSPVAAGGEQQNRPVLHPQPFAAWPPRLLSSETDPHFLEDGVFPPPHDRLVNVFEEEEEDNFEDTVNEDTNMPGRQTAADILAKLQAEQRAWDVEVTMIKQSGEATDVQLRALEEDYNSMRTKFKAATNAGGYEDDTKVNLDQIMATLGADLRALQRLRPLPVAGAAAGAAAAAAQHVPPAVDPDIEVERSVKRLSAHFENLNKRITTTTTSVHQLLGRDHVPGPALTRKVSNHKEDAEKVLTEGHDLDKRITAELSLLENEGKRNADMQELEKKLDRVRKEVARVQIACDQYLDKQLESQASSKRLQRLSLPKWSGKKTDYLHFKQQFLSLADYGTDKERVHALQEHCLPPKAKAKVSKCTKLADCWVILDADHGGESALAKEILAELELLKTPTTDEEMVNFVESIQNGVMNLKSIQSGPTHLTAAAFIIEAKLDKSLLDVYTRKLQDDDEDNTYDALFKFLTKEKAAAQSRRNINRVKVKKDVKVTEPRNKPDKVKKSDDDLDQSKSLATGIQESRQARGVRGAQGGGSQGGQGRGRGGQQVAKPGNNSDRSNGDKPRGGGRGAGGRRSRVKADSNCLVCQGDHSTGKCDTWRDLSHEKLELLALATTNLEKRLCDYCLEPGHPPWRCFSTEELGCACGSGVSMYVCCKTAECKSRANWPKTNLTKTNLTSAKSNAVQINGSKLGATLNPILMVKVDKSPYQVRTMFDNCSQSSFIRDSCARKLKLKGTPVSYVLVCTDGSETKMMGNRYEIVLLDRAKNRHCIEVIGIETISNSYSGARLVKPIHLPPGSVKRFLSNSDVQRSPGLVDILIGTDLAALHPARYSSIGNLVILRSPFGSGWTLMGHHRDYVLVTSPLPKQKVSVNVSQVKSVRNIACNVVGTKDIQFLEAISTESVGVNVKPRCRTCKIKTENCTECQMISNNTTFLEYLQDQQIAENIKKLPDEDGYIVSYPYNSELSQLQPNMEICRTRTEQMERTLKKSQRDLEDINNKINESFCNGIFRYLSDEEIAKWDGPVHYLPMSLTYKESESTPIRLCFDSGQPDRNGRSLNDCMGKGRNPINHFNSVILNFRAAEQVACGDISKMFNRIKVQDLDMHLRRFLVRPDGLGGKLDWKIAVPTVVNFGETAAPAVATAVKNRAADDNKHISEEVAMMIKRDCIMDDINVSAGYDQSLDENIKKAEQILAPGNFSFKSWLKSGVSGEQKELQSSDLSKSLGLFWNTGKDVLKYKIKLNFHKKKRNRYLGPYTTLETLHDDFPNPVTKRLCLKLNHSVFDPARLLQPWMMRPRLAFRQILFHERENDCAGWDNALPDKFREQWIKLTEEMFALESLEFPRSLVPRNYNKKVKPLLVLFSDGSDLGQCTVAYLVWELEDGSAHVSLVTSITKIASMAKITTPKSELVAAQLQSRLRAWLKENLDIEFGEVLHIVDASIILGMIKNISLKFDTFSGPRITEIQMTTEIEEWWWTDTLQNPSDLGTRGKCSIKDLSEGEMWREGPDWLKLPRSEWPLRSDFRKQEIPGLKKEFQILPTSTSVTKIVKIHEMVQKEESDENMNQVQVNVNVSEDFNSITNVLNVSKYKCWFKLVDAAAQILEAKYLWMKKKLSREGKQIPHRADLVKEAKQMLLQSMMPETKKMLEKTKLTNFIIHEKDGLVMATTRNKQESQNPDDLVVLSPKHPLTEKILYSFHNVNHRGVQYGVARSRIYFWIPQASKMMKKIKKDCFTCRLRDAEAMQQLMAPLPSFRLKPSPVWHYSMLDLIGPIEVTNFINQRSKRKTWAVIITCLTTRACWVYLAESFSTDHLLSVMRKHESRNGSPAEIYADLGRQIVGADRVMKEAIDELDQQEVEKFAATRGTKFVFGTPHFPQGQGAVERLVQEIKKNLKVITKRLLTFGELDTLLAEASYLVNSRPLQPNPTLGEDAFISPNDVLFGRSDLSPPVNVVNDSSLTRKAAMKQKIMDEFWQKWSTSYYQSLVSFQKWRSRHRDAKVGDVILILDREVEKGKFTTGIIDSVKVDPDNVVRTVTVKYKLKQKKKKKETDDIRNYSPTATKYVERNVRGLALLVTAEERKQIEKVDLDLLRFNFPKKSPLVDQSEGAADQDDDNDKSSAVDQSGEASNEDEEIKKSSAIDQSGEAVSENEENVNSIHDSEEEEDVRKKKRNKNLQEIPRTSTGRIRWGNFKYRK